MKTPIRFIFLIIGCLCIGYWLGEQPKHCTPSQEYQQLTEQLSEISSDMNILLQLSEIK